jgi:hypothetical protein
MNDNQGVSGGEVDLIHQPYRYILSGEQPPLTIPSH